MIADISLDVVWYASALSIIDVTLTYYLLWYDKKINQRPHFKELSPIGAYILKITKGGPWGLSLGALFSQSIIWGFFFFGLRWDPVSADIIEVMYIFCGAIGVAVWGHIFNIMRMDRIAQTRKIIEEKIDVI